ncbi:hypothetical protein CRENBAI_012398 [Crenichthys baileyi]|uniref:Uncharacterized protein n=1 Tax=Crenichthys baileyi TaxID=28760 RepID=A0AAV9RFN6_9TELE
MKRMLRVLNNLSHFMKNPYLHNDLQRFHRSPQNATSLLAESLAQLLLPLQMMADKRDEAISIPKPATDLINDKPELANEKESRCGSSDNNIGEAGNSIGEAGISIIGSL